MKNRKASVAARLAAACLMTISALAPSLVRADEPTTKPADTTVAKPAEKTGRDQQAVIKEYQAKSAEIGKLSKGDMSDAAVREKAAPALTPVLKEQLALVDELVVVKAIPASMTSNLSLRSKGLLYLLDADTKTKVDAEAAGTDANAMSAKATQLMGHWISTKKEDQSKVADEVEALDKQHTDSEELTRFTYNLAMQTSDKSLSERLSKVATDTMDNAASKQIKKQAAMMAKMREQQAAAEKKMKDLEGKEFTLAAKTVDGKDFTTADLKGKVIMVDFWATWCGPCVAGLPEVKEMYAKYHSQGFEIVGVSNDYTADALTSFIAKEKMPWPQLWNEEDGKHQKWNRTTTGYGINGIPRLFLIDKKGVLRTIEARSNMTDMIPKLLAE